MNIYQVMSKNIIEVMISKLVSPFYNCIENKVFQKIAMNYVMVHRL